MSKVVKGEQPCPKCPSSDAFHIYDDGHGYCFSCGYYQKSGGNKELEMESLGYKDWRAKESSYKFYHVERMLREDGNEYHRYPYRKKNGKGYAYKLRGLESKAFYTEGFKESKLDLFGQDLFPSGSAKAITITEGEEDAVACFQMMGSKYPVVSVQSAATAKKNLQDNYDYLNSFDEIYFCFDNDDAGKNALEQCVSLFPYDKVRIVSLEEYKDASDYLTNGATKTFYKRWWGAKRYTPDNIVNDPNIFWDWLVSEDQEASCEYPWQTLNKKTYGIRTGELVLLTAQEGQGKTEFLRAIEYHVLVNTKDRIGILHLEESGRRAIQGLLTYKLHKPVHLPDHKLSVDELKEAWDEELFDRVVVFNHFGSIEIERILTQIEFMVRVQGCKYIFVDHISLMVSDQREDERKALDEVSTRLVSLAKGLDVAIFVVSHVNDNGLTRGSRNISKVADLRIDLLRDHKNVSEEIRNTTALMISKNRFSGLTGPAGFLKFDTETYVLSEKEGEENYEEEMEKFLALQKKEELSSSLPFDEDEGDSLDDLFGDEEELND